MIIPTGWCLFILSAIRPTYSWYLPPILGYPSLLTINLDHYNQWLLSPDCHQLFIWNGWVIRHHDRLQWRNLVDNGWPKKKSMMAAGWLLTIGSLRIRI